MKGRASRLLLGQRQLENGLFVFCGRGWAANNSILHSRLNWPWQYHGIQQQDTPTAFVRFKLEDKTMKEKLVKLEQGTVKIFYRAYNEKKDPLVWTPMVQQVLKEICHYILGHSFFLKYKNTLKLVENYLRNIFFCKVEKLQRYIINKYNCHKFVWVHRIAETTLQDELTWVTFWERKLWRLSEDLNVYKTSWAEKTTQKAV